MVGVVTNATARDTDEIVTEKVPLYFRRPGRGIRPGRNEIQSVNRPSCAAASSSSPATSSWPTATASSSSRGRCAADVARYARRILDGDKDGRRRLYERLGLPKDKSVE